MRIDLGEDEQPEIGLIALIDCIFFLLMFFMVATSFKQQDSQRKEREIAILLPQAEVSLDATRAAPAPLVITVDAQGRLFLAQRPVTLQGLRDHLRAEAAKQPRTPVRIDGDRRTAYQDIVHVLDLCQFEGLTEVSMRTLPP